MHAPSLGFGPHSNTYLNLLLQQPNEMRRDVVIVLSNPCGASSTYPVPTTISTSTYLTLLFQSDLLHLLLHRRSSLLHIPHAMQLTFPHGSSPIRSIILESQSAF